MNEEVWTSERCFITELLNEPASPQVSLARCRVEPGVTTELHRLTVAEWYVLESGRGLVELGDARAREVGAGDVVTIPAGMPQRITNTGQEDLVFQCICLPRFTPDCYESLEPRPER